MRTAACPTRGEGSRKAEAVWDETIVLPGAAIGELSNFARRSGASWFLAVMCGPAGRTIRVPLSFLGEGPYWNTLVRDEPDRDDAVVVEQAMLGREVTVTLELRDGGGFVAHFTR
jgi:alpha-glucosidase